MPLILGGRAIFLNINTMFYKKLSQAGSQPSATATATSLKNLIQTADSNITDADLAGIEIIELNPEGDIRYLVGAEPTTAKGMALLSGQTRVLEGVHPKDLYLIASATTKVNIQLGYAS